MDLESASHQPLLACRVSSGSPSISAAHPPSPADKPLSEAHQKTSASRAGSPPATTSIANASTAEGGAHSPRTPRFGKQEILEGVETGEVPAQLQSEFQTIMNTVNLYVGAGLLSMPYAMRIGGWVGLAVLGVCTAVSCTTAHFISYSCDALPPGVPPSYPRLGKAAFGPTGEWILLGAVMLEFWGALSMCLIIAWRSLAISLSIPEVCLPHLDVCVSARTAVVVLTLIVAIPIILIRSFSRLSSVAMSGVISSALLSTVMLTAWSLDPSGAQVEDPAAHEHSPVDWGHLPVAAGIFIVSLSGHAGLPSLRRGMATPQRFPWCLKATFICIFILYGTMALFGYLYFGKSAQVLVTGNLNSSGSLAGIMLLHWGSFSFSLSQALSLLVGLSVFTTVPPLTYVLGEILTDFSVGLFVQHESAPAREGSAQAAASARTTTVRFGTREGWETFFRVFVLGFGYFMALSCYDYLAKLESLVGGVLSMTASLLLPTLVFYSLRSQSLSKPRLMGLRTFILLVLLIPFCVVYGNIAQN